MSGRQHEARTGANGSGFNQSGNHLAVTTRSHSTTNGAPRQELYSPSGIVVALIEHGQLYRSLHGQRHMLRTPPAWAFDASHIDQAQAVGVARIVVIDLDDNRRRYEIDFPDFQKFARRIDRGHGAQWACALVYWRTTGPTAAADGRQLGLWEA